MGKSASLAYAYYTCGRSPYFHQHHQDVHMDSFIVKAVLGLLLTLYVAGNGI